MFRQCSVHYTLLSIAMELDCFTGRLHREVMFLIAPRLDYIEGPTIVLSSTLWERIIKSLLTYDKKDAWKFQESCAGKDMPMEFPHLTIIL